MKNNGTVFYINFQLYPKPTLTYNYARYIGMKVNL